MHRRWGEVSWQGKIKKELALPLPLYPFHFLNGLKLFYHLKCLCLSPHNRETSIQYTKIVKLDIILSVLSSCPCLYQHLTICLDFFSRGKKDETNTVSLTKMIRKKEVHFNLVKWTTWNSYLDITAKIDWRTWDTLVFVMFCFTCQVTFLSVISDRYSSVSKK